MEHEKASKDQQWQEKSQRPIAARAVTSADAEHYRMVQAMSFGCPPEDIKYEYTRIVDTNDEDRDECLNLTYYLRVRPRLPDPITRKVPEPFWKYIYSIKMPVPSEIKAKAEEIRKKQLLTDGRGTPASTSAQTPQKPKLKRTAPAQSKVKVEEID